MNAFQDFHRFRIETERRTPLPDGIQAGKQGGIQIDRGPMRRQARRHLHLDRLQGVIGGRAGKGVKDRIDPGQQFAASFQRDDGVGKIGRRGIARDTSYFRIVIAQRLGIGRGEMLRPDAI